LTRYNHWYFFDAVIDTPESDHKHIQYLLFPEILAFQVVMQKLTLQTILCFSADGFVPQLVHLGFSIHMRRDHLFKIIASSSIFINHYTEHIAILTNNVTDKRIVSFLYRKRFIDDALTKKQKIREQVISSR
jgi:hypothetical protein